MLPLHQKHIIFPGGHSISLEYRRQCNKEIAKWLDRYLGLVSGAQDDRNSQLETGEAPSGVEPQDSDHRLEPQPTETVK